MDRKMDKYIKLEDAIDLFWTVDPENNGAFRWRNSPPGRRKGETQHEK